MSDDDIEFTGRIIQPQNCTSSRCRYLSTNVYEAMDLRSIRDHAQRLLDVLMNVELFLLMAAVVLSIAKKIGKLCLLRKLVHLLKIILAFIALCENELDLLSEAEIDICAIRTDEFQPLVVYPNINRKIDDLELDFAQRMTRFTKEELKLLLLHLRIPQFVITSRQRYKFTGEEILIVCLARITTGDP